MKSALLPPSVAELSKERDSGARDRPAMALSQLQYAPYYLKCPGIHHSRMCTVLVTVYTAIRAKHYIT
ncbi:hypothetical protein ACU8KH_04627 [Lachancea thermotolerans]